MTTNDIERLLRRPANDEPAILPALVLPRETATGGLRDRSLDTALGFGRMTLTMRVAIGKGIPPTALAAFIRRLSGMPSIHSMTASSYATARFVTRL